MNYCAKFNELCESANVFGHCKFTACHNIRIIEGIFELPDVKTYMDFAREALIFPQTIGDITFYNSKELIKWVEDQQKFNKDPNYGVGNWC